MSNWKSLASRWSSYFPSGPSPKCIVEVPGRVNLIGEHVDHQSYPVCPCAIRQSMGACVSIEAKTDKNSYLEVRHTSAETYPSRTFSQGSDIRVLPEKLWTNYVAAAYLGAIEYFLNGEKADQVGTLFDPRSGLTKEDVENCKKSAFSPLHFSIRILYDGNVPIASGLSSSAALVCATALAICQAKQNPPSMHILSDLCAKAERYSGVASGGMDQAAVLLSEAGKALLIHFDPLHVKPISLPEGGALVIVNSCVEAPKAKAAHKMYNKRVFELKLACLCSIDGNEAENMMPKTLLDLTVRDVVREYNGTTEAEVLRKLPLLHDFDDWDKESALKLISKECLDVLLDKRCGRDVWDKNDTFNVHRRLRHVLSEALRVEEFAKVAEDQTIAPFDRLKRLGELMSASGLSLFEDFDCSPPEIQKLVGICMKHGAYGARITGAGWGGCMVALVPESEKENIIEAVKNEYFFAPDDGSISPEARARFPPKNEIDTVVFSCVPSAGASVLAL